MGTFDNIRAKAEKVIADNPDKVEKVSDAVIDRAGDAINKATGGKYSDKVEAAKREADKRIGH